jgi:tRNA pseudouridine55 synthase
MDGLILVRKPVSATSHDVVAALRKILGQPKIGHFGTLDPLASGLLLAAAGKATRLFPFYAKLDKIYEGRIRLGFSTDTYDAEGRPTSPECAVTPFRDAVEDALRQFEGDIVQIPPPYSAKKVDGKPLYVYARRQTPVEGRPFPVRVDAFHLRRFDAPFFDFVVYCGSGTYIRTLAHDLGQKLGCGAHLAQLVRTGIGEFRIEDALTLEQIRDFYLSGSPAGFLRPMETVLPSLPRINLNEEGVQRIRNGRPVSSDHLAAPDGLPDRPAEPETVVRLFGPDGRLIALAKRGVLPKQYAPFLVL